jgi:hypothetical protein
VTEIYDNAVASIILGIEDFREGSDARMISAARNYYAGLLLIAKECLVRAAPEADAMEVIGAKFEPVPDGEGGVEHEVVGHTTVDFAQLKKRFKAFDLSWPEADVEKLQRFRNDVEHYHLRAPEGALREAIASSFPMIIDFFETLGEDPREALPGVWETILEQTEAFNKVQKSCVDSLERINWPGEVHDLNRISCRACGSSLVGQVDRDNTSSERVRGACSQCGEEFENQDIVEMVVAASYEIDAFLAARNGEFSPVTSCPECGADAYVETGALSLCFHCHESVAGECMRCSTTIDVHEYSSDYPDLCSYCAHMTEKVMRE